MTVALATAPVDPAPVATVEEHRRCGELIDAWAAARLAEDGALVAVDRQPDAARWYLRLAGDEKDFVAVWLTLRQRTLHHEAQVMPAPETNVQQTYEYLLRRNAELHRARLVLGTEDAVYLVGEVAVVDVTEDELDRILGSSLAYVDELFPTAMTIGFAGRYRRRRRTG